MSWSGRLLAPRTVAIVLSWRLLAGVVVGVAGGLLGLSPLAAVGLGLAVTAALVVSTALSPPTVRTPIDPFAVGEPWRRYVQSAQRSRRALDQTVLRTPQGPLRARLDDVAGRLDRAIEESWEIARRGDEIDDAITRIDPVRLRAQLDVLGSTAPGESGDAALASLRSQLESADRLKALSASTADRLRLTQARLDELVARAAEVSVGRSDTSTYTHDVDDLVVELEGLRQAVAETNELA